MISAITIVMFIAACYVLHRSVMLVTHLSHTSWNCKFSFLGLGVSLGLMTAGAWGSVFYYPWGPVFLLLGVTGFFMFDRREQNLQRKVTIVEKQRERTNNDNHRAVG